MKDLEQTQFPNDSRPEGDAEQATRFEQLAMLAAFGELSDAERDEFETCLASDEACRTQFREFQEMRDFSAAVTPTQAKPETISTILAAAQTAADARKAPSRQADWSAEPVWEWIRSWVLQPMAQRRWATAGACAGLLFVLLSPLFLTTPLDTTVQNQETELLEQATVTELVDMEIAAVDEDLGYLEEEMGLWLDELDVS